MLPKQRKRVPYEHPRGRRVNAIGVLLPYEDVPALWWDPVPRTLTAHDVLTIIEAIPRGPGDRVNVLDNASIHQRSPMHEARPGRQERGIHLDDLPAYSPELNQIEPFCGVIKHTELPERT